MPCSKRRHLLERSGVLSSANPSRAVDRAHGAAGIAESPPVCHAFCPCVGVEGVGGDGRNRDSVCDGTGRRIEFGRDVGGRFGSKFRAEGLGKLLVGAGELWQLGGDKRCLALAFELGLLMSLSLPPAFAKVTALGTAQEHAEAGTTR